VSSFVFGCGRLRGVKLCFLFSAGQSDCRPVSKQRAIRPSEPADADLSANTQPWLPNALPNNAKAVVLGGKAVVDHVREIADLSLLEHFERLVDQGSVGMQARTGYVE
jgi:hypothetical protein